MSVRPHFLRESPDPASDVLSEVLRLVEASSSVSGGFSVSGTWSAPMEMSASALKFVVILKGSAQLQAEGLSSPLDLAVGDVVVLNNRRWATMSGGPRDGLPQPLTAIAPTMDAVDDRDDDILFGGHIEINPAGQSLLAAALPPVLHVRSSSDAAAALRGQLELLYAEVLARRVGAGFAIDQHCRLLVLTVLRAHLAAVGDLPAGWLRVLADEHLRPAVALMHAQPGRRWRLDELARAAAMSRTAFADRFRTVAGVPPLAYLSAWRMRLAQRALRDAFLEKRDPDWSSFPRYF